MSVENTLTTTVKDEKPNEEQCGTVYVGHIPHGFYYNELKGYFNQFGAVNKLRLARSKKTGGYKGYAFIQFASEEVAKIAAEAMNNYLMFDKLLKCHFIPEEKLHPRIWKSANKKFKWVDRALREKKMHNKPRSKEELKKASQRLLKNDNKKRMKLAKLGINYKFSGYAGAIKRERKQKKLMKKSKSKNKQTVKVKE